MLILVKHLNLGDLYALKWSAQKLILLYRFEVTCLHSNQTESKLTILKKVHLNTYTKCSISDAPL